MAIDMSGNDPGSKAAANITKIIEAAANAKQSQIELQKQVMLSKIGQQQELQTNKAKLHQENVSGIEGQNMQMNWMKGLNGGSPSEGGAPSNIQGVANAGTPATMGSPAMAPPAMDAMSMAQRPAPQAPAPMTMANPAQQPQNNAQSQMSMAPAPSPAMTAMPATSPIGKPLPPPPGRISIGPDGKPMMNPNYNTPDNQVYTNIYNKWKSGQQLSDGESKWVQQKFANGPDGKPLPKSNSTPQEIGIQGGLRNFEKTVGWPQGSAMFNPAAKPGEIPIMMNPIWKSQQDAINQYNITAPDRYGKLAEADLMKVFSYRSGDLGVQNSKIGQAMHIRQLFDQSYDPKTGQYNINSTNFHEATQGLANLVSGSTQQSDARVGALTQRTLKGDINGALTYAFGSPKNGTTQDIAKMYVDTIDRQADTAQTLKDKYLSDIKRMDSFNQLKRVDPQRAQNLYDASFGINYKYFINKPWAERIKEVTGKEPDEGGAGGNGSQNGMVTMTSPNGKQYSFSADQAEEARKNGWQ